MFSRKFVRSTMSLRPRHADSIFWKSAGQDLVELRAHPLVELGDQVVGDRLVNPRARLPDDDADHLGESVARAGVRRELGSFDDAPEQISACFDGLPGSRLSFSFLLRHRVSLQVG